MPRTSKGMKKGKQHITAYKTVFQPETHIFQTLHDLHFSMVLLFCHRPQYKCTTAGV